MLGIFLLGSLVSLLFPPSLHMAIPQERIRQAVEVFAKDLPASLSAWNEDHGRAFVSRLISYYGLPGPKNEKWKEARLLRQFTDLMFSDDPVKEFAAMCPEGWQSDEEKVDRALKMTVAAAIYLEGVNLGSFPEYSPESKGADPIPLCLVLFSGGSRLPSLSQWKELVAVFHKAMNSRYGDKPVSKLIASLCKAKDTTGGGKNLDLHAALDWASDYFPDPESDALRQLAMDLEPFARLATERAEQCAEHDRIPWNEYATRFMKLTYLWAAVNHRGSQGNPETVQHIIAVVKTIKAIALSDFAKETEYIADCARHSKVINKIYHDANGLSFCRYNFFRLVEEYPEISHIRDFA
jgi:hypothetical protein